ncbi:MAG: FeoB-associated Cys-rich membrane protein [Bacteroidota bacterium]
MIQEILVLITFAAAVLFLIKKFVWKSPEKSKKACGASDCACH